MKLRKLRIHRHHLPHICGGVFALVLGLGFAGPFAVSRPASANLLALRSLKMSDGTSGATGVSYTFSFSVATGGPLGSIRYQICSNYIYDPVRDICQTPVGFDDRGVSLSSSSGVTDFVLNPPLSSANTLLLSRPAATVVSPQPLTYEFSGLTNPSANGTFYVRIATYASTDGSGPETDYGTVVGNTTQDISITTEVPPYLQFCTGITIAGYNCGTAEGSFISFGELSTTSTRSATSQMLASTNAAYGYSITLAGTTLTAGNNVIPPMNGEGSQIGTSQFGLNARANSSPAVGADPDGPGLVVPKPAYGTPNSYRFGSGDIVASTDQPDDYRKLTVDYIVNRSSGQAPGRYVATISYICLANF